MKTFLVTLRDGYGFLIQDFSIFAVKKHFRRNTVKRIIELY